MSLLDSPGARTLLRGADTDGACSVLELRLPAGRCFPTHRHSGEGISLLVLSGTLALDCPEGRDELTSGQWLRFPVSVPCRLEAVTELHLLMVCVPAALEGLASALGNAEPVDPDDVAALLAVAGVSFVPDAALPARAPRLHLRPQRPLEA